MVRDTFARNLIESVCIGNRAARAVQPAATISSMSTPAPIPDRINV